MEKELTFVGHLEEMRRRIIISLVWLGLASVASLPCAGTVLRILKSPAAGSLDRLAFFSPQDAFLIYMRIAFLCGIIVSLPVILYQVWGFISPAVDVRFKRYGLFFIIFSSAAFFTGCLFAYFALLPAALRFLLSFGSEELVPVISAQHYISFVVMILLGCGVIFQMPVLSFLLTKVGVVNAAMLRRRFGIAVVAISVIAAVITPTTDIFNMLAMALPMLLLYEISIWISALAGRRV